MKFKLYFLFILLAGMVTDVSAQYVTFNLTVKNASSGGDGSTAVKGQTLTYTFLLTNLTDVPVTNVRLIGDIPFGGSYQPNSTRQNNVPVADVSGNMPYVAPAGGILGTLAGKTTVMITYNVLITNNGGKLVNHAVFKGTQGAGNLYVSADPVLTHVLQDNIIMSYDFYGIFTTGIGINANSLYNQVRKFDVTTGLSQGTLYFGNSSTATCLEIGNPTPLTSGTLLKNARGVALDRRNLRLYYTNTITEENLAYLDLTANPVTANIWPAATPAILEPGATTTGQIITRMCFSSEDIGYALTDNGQDLIKFVVPATGTDGPVITHLGPLVNDPVNGAGDVLAETGGDIWGDSNGRLFLVTGSAKLYRIIPATQVATYIGTITNLPTGYIVTAAADAADDPLFTGISGVYITASRPLNATSLSYGSYNVDLTTMSATQLSTSATSTAATDLASYFFGNYSHYITCYKSAVVTGNYIDYTIEVTNSGNISAPGVSLNDPIPDHSDYVTGSTTINDVPVADAGGEMPFAVAGGALIPAGDAPGIIKPGKVTIKFRVQRQSGWDICHSAQLTYYDMNNNQVILPVPSQAPGQIVAQTCVSPDARKASVDTPQTTLTGSVQVGPNPFSNNLSVQVTLVKDETALIRLTNLQGRVVYSKMERLSTGVNNLNLAPALPQGIYVIEILTGSKRIYKQKLEKL